jgi:hypothetical protein
LTTLEIESLVAERWRQDPSRHRAAFENAEPFPLLVFDDFLVPSFAEDLHDQFPAIDAMPRSRDYMFGNKHELSSVEAQGPAGQRFHELVLSDWFRTFLQEATGHDVFVDPGFFGGGFHQGGDGSFLDMHVDFNMHPQHDDWLRTLNILIYLSKDWEPSWGGELLVKLDPADEPRAIEPRFNRAVVMLTSDTTFHGYRKTSMPPGCTRKSLATYAYQSIDAGTVPKRTTGWNPEEAGLLKRLTAKHFNSAVLAKNRVLGSRTAKNR